MKSIEGLLSTYYDDAKELHQWLFSHPEISGKEYEGSKRIVELLKKQGYDVIYPFSGLETAFKATFGSGYTHKVALLVEYDALPDIGHACGHSLSGAISVLAGLVLKEFQEELDTAIHLIGTPTEETVGAKCDMVRQGVFEDYQLAMMVHLDNKSRVSISLQALDSYLFTFKGKAAHASAAPWEGRNAFNGAQLMFHALDMLRQHMKPGCQIHGIIRQSGEAPNIVPERVSLELYTRALTRDLLDELNLLVEDCAKGAALATQTTWTKEPTANGYDNLRPNATAEKVLRGIFKHLGIDDESDPEEIFGSSDAGNVSQICPTLHPTLQVAPSGVAIHTRDFAESLLSPRADEALREGALMIIHEVLEIFSDPELITQLDEDFKKA